MCLLTSITARWFLTVLPTEYTFRFYHEIFVLDLTLLSIKNSLFLSSLSTLIDIVLGVTIAYLLARKRVPGRDVLDALAMLPLALPGLVMAFGYVAAFWQRRSILGSIRSRCWSSPMRCAVSPIWCAQPRRFPADSVALEEAAMNLGASPLKTIYQITFPLIFANLVAGAVLCFSFAMLEVSDSLILALKEQHYPITKAIYTLLKRMADGPISRAQWNARPGVIGGKPFLS